MTQSTCEIFVNIMNGDVAGDASEVLCGRPAAEHLGCWVCTEHVRDLERIDPQIVQQYRAERARQAEGS